jgi:hypothetical protein
MDPILFNQRFNGFLRSPYFASLDDQGQQESIIRYRDNALADFPNLNPDDVNRIVELENKKYLREAGKGRAIPTGWQEKVKLPNWDKDWDVLSKDERVNRIEEFKGKASEYANLFPTQKEDAEFYFEQLGRTLEREVQGEDKGWVGDKGSRIMQGFTAGLANYTGMTGVAEWMEDFWHENPKYDGDLMADLAQGVGDVGASMTIFLGAAAITAKTMGAGAAMTGGTLASLGSNSLMRYNEGYKNAIDAGLDPDTAHETGINSVPAAFIDVLGDRILAARIRPTRDMGVLISGTTNQKREFITELIKDNTTKSKLLSLAGSSLSEGLTEAVGDYYAGYAAYATDPNNEAPPELDESKRSFLIGMILGGGIAAPGTFAPMIGNKSGQTRTEDGVDTTLSYSNRTIRDLSELNINLDSIEETGQQPVFDLLAQGKYRDAYKMTQEIMAGKMQPDATTEAAPDVATSDATPEQQPQQFEQQPEQQDARVIAFKELSTIAELDRKTTTPINNHSRKMAVDRLNNVAPARLNVEKSIRGWADSTTSIRSQKERAPRANAVMAMVDHLAGKWQQQNKDKDVNVFYGKLNINSEESIEGLRGVIQSIEGAPQAAVSRQDGQMTATITPASDLNTVVKSITSMLRKSGMMESIMGEQDYAKVVEVLEAKDGWTVEKDNQLGDMFTGWVSDSSTGAELGNVFARLRGYVRDVYESVKRLAYPSSWTRMKKLDEEFSRMFQLEGVGEFEMGIKPRPRAKGQTVAPNATKPPTELESVKAKVAAEQARNKAAELKAAIANDPSIQTNENTDITPEGDSITDYLNTLIDKHRGNARKDVRLRNIYTRLRDAIAQNNPDLGFKYEPTFEHKGVYNGFTNTITVSDLADTETLIHEISHAITDAKLNAGTRRHAGSYVQKVQALSKENTPEGRIARAYLKAAKQLGKGKEIGKKYDGGDVSYGDYAFYNLNEFVAFAMSNTQFQDTLSGIKYENSTLLDRIVEYIKEAAGFISDMSGIDINSILLSPNALYDTLANVNQLIEARGGQENTNQQTINESQNKEKRSERDAIYRTASTDGVAFTDSDSGNYAIVSSKVNDIINQLKSIDGAQARLDWLHKHGFLQLINGETHVNHDERVMVLMRIGNINIPFYISTGMAGKKNVASGKWYAVFGIGSSGWINKGRESDISNQYGYPILQKIAKILNDGVGFIEPSLVNDLKNYSDINSKMNLGIEPASSHVDWDTFWNNVVSALNKINEQTKSLYDASVAEARSGQDTAVTGENNINFLPQNLDVVKQEPQQTRRQFLTNLISTALASTGVVGCLEKDSPKARMSQTEIKIREKLKERFQISEEGMSLINSAASRTPVKSNTSIVNSVRNYIESANSQYEALLQTATNGRIETNIYKDKSKNEFYSFDVEKANTHFLDRLNYIADNIDVINGELDTVVAFVSEITGVEVGEFNFAPHKNALLSNGWRVQNDKSFNASVIIGENNIYLHPDTIADLASEDFQSKLRAVATIANELTHIAQDGNQTKYIKENYPIPEGVDSIYTDWLEGVYYTGTKEQMLNSDLADNWKSEMESFAVSWLSSKAYLKKNNLDIQQSTDSIIDEVVSDSARKTIDFWRNLEVLRKMGEAQLEDAAAQIEHALYKNDPENVINFLPRITPEQDAAYLQAVEAGDMDTAQRMVDEAAEKAGYSAESVTHITPAQFESFDISLFKTGDVQGFYFAGSEGGSNWGLYTNGNRTIKAYLKMSNPARMAVEDMKGTPEENRKSLEASGFDGVIDDSYKGNQYIVFNPNQIKSADPVTYDNNGNVIPLSQRFNPEENNINFLPSEQYLPHQKKSQKFRSLYDKLDKIQKGKLDSKVDAATQSIISAAKRINKTDLEYLDQDSLEAVDKIVNNIYKARTRGLKDPAVRLDAAKVIGQIEIAVSAIEGAVVAKMLADYDGILDIDSLEFDSLDSLRQAINVAMGEEQFKAGLSQKNAEKLEAIYQGYRDKTGEIVAYLLDRFKTAENYLKSMEAIHGEFLTNDMREAIIENWNHVVEEDHSETVGKDLYLTFFTANAMMDGQILHLRDIAFKRMADKRDDNTNFEELTDLFRDPYIKTPVLNVFDLANKKAELQQTSLLRLSKFEKAREWIMNNLLGDLNRSVMADHGNLKGMLTDRWIDAVKAFHKKTGKKDLGSIDREIISIAIRAVQVQRGELADAALVKNMEAEMKSLDNRIEYAYDNRHKQMLEAEIKPLIQNFYKGVETMDQLIAELPKRIAAGEASIIGEARLDLYKTIQDIFSVFGGGSKVISEGIYGQSWKGFDFYVPHLLESRKENKNEYGDLEKSAFTYTEGYDLPGSNPMPGFIKGRTQQLGDESWYAYNVEYTVLRGIEMMAAEHATVVARQVLSQRLKEGSRVYNLIAIDENGKAHKDRIKLIKDYAVEIVKRAATRGEVVALGVGGIQAMLGASGRVNLSSPHHLVSQPAAGMIDYISRSGNVIENTKNYFGALYHYATNPAEVADFFKKNYRVAFDRSYIETLAMDQRRQIKATEKALVNTPMVKGLSRLYDGFGDAITFGIRNGDKIGTYATYLAEYKRRMEAKGHKFSGFRELLQAPPDLQELSRVGLEVDKNINSSTKIMRGDIFSDRKNYMIIIKNIFLAYAPHVASLATQFNMAGRDIAELIRDRAPAGEILAKARVMGAILAQTAMFAGSRFAFGHYMSHFIANLVKDFFDDEEGKLAELTEAVRVARKKGDPVEIEQANEMLRNAKVVRNVVNQIKSNTTYDGFFKSAIRDMAGSTFLAFNNPTLLRLVSDPIDDAMKRGHADFRKETVKGYQEQIREAKKKEDWMLAARLEEKLIDFRGERYIPISFDTYNQEMGGAFGIFATNLNRQWGRARDSLDPVKEFNWNDFVLMATVAGIGQSEVRKFLNAVDQIENEQFENNIKFQEELIPAALEKREEKRQREIKKILGIR